MKQNLESAVQPGGKVKSQNLSAGAVLDGSAHERLDPNQGNGHGVAWRSEPSHKDLKVEIGIESQVRKEIADGLSALLADTYVVYLKTQSYHWNVTGPMFRTLHLMFEEQYTELALAVDLLAERIRALGFATPASFAEFSELTSIEEERGVPDPQRMIAVLCEAQESVLRTARGLVAITDEAHDLATSDLLAQRMKVHEKMAWMLRSLLA